MLIKGIRSHTVFSLECIAMTGECSRSISCPLFSADACDIRREFSQQGIERVVHITNRVPSESCTDIATRPELRFSTRLCAYDKGEYPEQ